MATSDAIQPTTDPPPGPEISVPAAPPGFVDAWPAFLETTRRKRAHAIWMIVGLALFALAARQDMGLAGMGILVAVVALHELGHLAAMWVFGYRDLAVFFIPFLGAAATGRKRDAPAWQRGLITLAGPVPGILLGWALVFLAPGDLVASPHFASLVGMLLVVNGINLLPVMPFDGGRLLNLTLFSRHPTLETVFAIVTGLGLAGLAAATQSWLLMALGLFTALGSFAHRRLLAVAHAVRAELAGASSDPERLPERQRFALYESATRALAANEQAASRPVPPQRRPKVLAAFMQVIFDRAIAPHASARAALALFLAYAASCALLWPLLRQL
jgi:Zn-dependent protease